MAYETAMILPLCGVVLGWLLGRCPYGIGRRQRRREEQMDRQWENLFAYDGQKQEGDSWKNK